MKYYNNALMLTDGNHRIQWEEKLKTVIMERISVQKLSINQLDWWDASPSQGYPPALNSPTPI